MSGGVSAYVPMSIPVSAPIPQPVAVQKPSPAPAPTPAAVAPKADIVSVLVAVVSEKTGYPAETINPDMDLEGDLGTIHQASRFSRRCPRSP
jgi:hypothetical protein